MVEETTTNGIVFDDSFDNPLVDEGDYEFVISAERRVLSTGKEKLNITYMIRSDVDQKFKGKRLYDDAWQDKNNPLWFDLLKQNKIVKTQKDLPGYKNAFTNQDELILYLNGLQLVATVEKVYDDYKQADVNKIKFLSQRPTAHYNPNLGTTSAGVSVAATESRNLDKIEIDEASLPF